MEVSWKFHGSSMEVLETSMEVPWKFCKLPWKFHGSFERVVEVSLKF
jgi:hypothetical protein